MFNEIVTGLRQFQANALLPSMVGETCAQLLRMTNPESNVVVGSSKEPQATQGGNVFVESQLLDENELSAVPFKCD